MSILIIFIIIIATISLIYYFMNPENHNSWNGGNAKSFNPKTEGGKLAHVTLQTIGLFVVWIIILGVIVASVL